MSLRQAVVLLVLLIFAGVAQAQEPMVRAGSPVSVNLRFEPGLLRADIEVAAATTVTLPVPFKPGLISFSGVNHRTEVAYDQKARTLSLSLQPGKYAITIRSL